MLRRLLSSPIGEDPHPAEEAREYIVLSKMQPLPPSSEPSCPVAFPPIDPSCWHQLDNSSFPFSIPETDFYWPNHIPAAEQFNLLQPLGNSLAPPSPPPLFPILCPTQLVVHNEKDFTPQLEERKKPGEMDEEEQRSEENREKLESPASSEERIQSCPYCDRSFSASKGSLRRHMAQCRRLKGIKKENPPPKRPRSPSSVEKNAAGLLINAPSSSSLYLSPATVDPSDPYQCRWCQFNTLYKGNMKRHLITCHRVSSDLLQRLEFNVERLRKFAENRPELEELPIRPRKDEGRVRKDRGGVDGMLLEEDGEGEEY